MTFQQKAYAVFWISLAIIASATVLALLNDRKVEGVSYWLFFSAMPLFIMGLPALFNQHIFNMNSQNSGEEESQERTE